MENTKKKHMPHIEARRLEAMRKVDGLAALRGITRTGPYITTMEKTGWKCTGAHEWQATPNSVMRGHGCPYCAGLDSAKDRTDKAAASRGITRTGPYVNKSTKTGWRCADGHEWEAIPGSISRGVGCPHCAGLLGAKERSDEAAKLRGITRIGEWNGAQNKTTWRGKCGHEWEARPVSVRRGSGCPYCVKNSPSKERTDKAAASRGITRVGEWENGQEKIAWRGKCGHEWMAKPANIIAGHNCPLCARNSCAKNRADEAAKSLGITRIGTYVSNRKKTGWRCPYAHEWETAPANIIQGSGCPTCACSGYAPNKPGTLYVLASECGGLMKIGITNNHKIRLPALANTTPFAFSPIHLHHDENGAVARRVEQGYHRILKAHNAGLTGFDGSTEWFKASKQVLEYIALL